MCGDGGGKNAAERVPATFNLIYIRPMAVISLFIQLRRRTLQRLLYICIYIYIDACALLYLYSSREDSFSDGRYFLEGAFGENLGLWADLRYFGDGRPYLKSKIFPIAVGVKAIFFFSSPSNLEVLQERWVRGAKDSRQTLQIILGGNLGEKGYSRMERKC